MATFTYWLNDLETRIRAVRAQATGLGRYFKVPRKDRTVVVFDTAAGLPEEIFSTSLGAYLRSIPLPVMIGDQIHAEGTGDTDEELPLALAQGTPVRTSRPSPGQLRKLYQEIAAEGYGGIVSIHLSSKLSGTVDAARLAATESTIPVEVVDTKTAGMAMGYAVLDVAVRAQNGASPQELAQLARAQAEHSDVTFTVPNLEQLRRGGRIPRMTGLIGQLLQVRPVLCMKDGAIILVDRPRNVSKAIDIMVTQAKSAVNHAVRPARIAVHGYGNLDQALELADSLTDLSTAPVPVLPLPAVLAAHLGLGALAISVSPEPQM